MSLNISQELEERLRQLAVEQDTDVNHLLERLLDGARLDKTDTITSAQPEIQQVRDILESITDAFFVLDHDWHFTYMNREAEHLLQRSRDALMGRSMWDEFPEAIGSTFYEQYHKAVKEQVTVAFTEYYESLATWFEVRAYPSVDGLSHCSQVKDRKPLSSQPEQLICQRAAFV